MISLASRAIYKYESLLELLGALRNTIKTYKSLYYKGNILYRDISENNIIITNPKTDGFRGMLINLDLTKELGNRRSGIRYYIGIIEFMAIKVLFRISYTYYYNLESFFYILI